MSEHRSLSEEITSTPEGMRIWQQERLIFENTERICELMQGKVSRSELASRLGTSKGYITQILNGKANLTLRTLSDIYLSLNRQVYISDGPVTVKNASEPNVLSVFTWDADNLESEFDDNQEPTQIKFTEQRLIRHVRA